MPNEGEEELRAMVHLQMLREGTQLLEERHEVRPLLAARTVCREALEELGEEAPVALKRCHHLHVVKEHDRSQSAEGCVVEHAREDDILEITHAVRLVNLGADRLVPDRNHLLEHDRLFQKRSVHLMRRQVRVVLERANHVHNNILLHEGVKQVCVVQHHNPVHQLEHKREPFRVLEVFTRPKHVEELPQIPRLHQEGGNLLTRKRRGVHNHLDKLRKVREIRGRQFRRADALRLVKVLLSLVSKLKLIRHHPSPREYV
mmetsp:Transcript_3537/g.12693  ORF Transcript_3537/g.12693 Transcript_3537/m.12693 type:complete len:259 (-) Transcript_3537:412-1188(-)